MLQTEKPFQCAMNYRSKTRIKERRKRWILLSNPLVVSCNLAKVLEILKEPCTGGGGRSSIVKVPGDQRRTQHLKRRSPRKFFMTTPFRRSENEGNALCSHILRCKHSCNQHQIDRGICSENLYPSSLEITLVK